MKRIVAIPVLVVTVVAAYTAGRVTGPNERLFSDVLNLVSRKYVDTISQDSLLLAASRGMIDEIGDPYAHLYTPEELSQYTQSHLGFYGGVGMLVTERDGKGEVQHVYPRTPASEAGIVAGDMIVAIDGNEIVNWPLEKITGSLRGEVGTPVRVSITHEGVRQDLSIKRAEIHLPAVAYDMMFGNVGYIPLTTFNETSAAEVRKAVEHVRQQGAKSLVLDLRGNGGGLVDQAVAITDIFLKSDQLVLAQREREDTINYKTRDNYDAGGMPVVVLVDRFTASASEIVAGALQDYKRAKIVGERTYGKGVVQTAFNTSGGAVVKFTTGKWFTPLGRTIQKPQGKDSLQIGGVHPDVTVAPDTFTTAESTFLRNLGDKRAAFFTALRDAAHQIAKSGTGDVVIRPADVTALFNAVHSKQIVKTRAEFDAAQEYIEYALAMQANELRNGEAAAKRVTLRRDRTLNTALTEAAGLTASNN